VELFHVYIIEMKRLVFSKVVPYLLHTFMFLFWFVAMVNVNIMQIGNSFTKR